MKELLEAGVHFGHQTKRWNPKMKEFIFGERNGIYIIDLQKTLKMFKDARKFVQDLARRQAHAVRRHQAAGPGRHRRRSAALRHVLHQPALAGRTAHQLGHGAEIGEAAEGTRRDGHGRPLRAAAQERSHQAGTRAQAPAGQPGRHQEHEPVARRDFRHRLEQGADRGARGAQAGHSGGRRGRYQLRSQRSGLRDPRQRRCAARDPPVCLEDF